jgi:transcriptional regulator GlxA family with amidase domain
MQIAHSAANLQPAPPLAQPCDDERVSRALLLMEQNVSEPLSVYELALRLGVSRRNLERLFMKHLGMSPLAAYIRLRLKCARWMLRSKRSLALIADETGFAGSSHLSKAFKSVYGHAPSEERLRSGFLSASHLPPEANHDGRRVFDVG